MTDRIEIYKENNKIWHVQKTVGDNPDYNYYGIDIKDEAMEEYPEGWPYRDRVMVVWVHKTTYDIGLDYMGEKTEAQNYVKGNLMTNPANKTALRNAILELFEGPELNTGYVIVTGPVDPE